MWSPTGKAGLLINYSITFGCTGQIFIVYRRASPEECATYHSHPVGVHPLPPPTGCATPTSHPPTTEPPTFPTHQPTTQPQELEWERECRECKRQASVSSKYSDSTFAYGQVQRITCMVGSDGNVSFQVYELASSHSGSNAMAQ